MNRGLVFVVALSERGWAVGERIREGLLRPAEDLSPTRPVPAEAGLGGGTVHLLRWSEGGPRLQDLVAGLWEECSALVLVTAAGIAVRTVAPLLRDKRADPGVVVVDEGARFAVSLVGGHLGGANELAQRVAAAIGAAPVVTTASDSLGYPALDLWARDHGLEVEDPAALRRLSAALIRGERVSFIDLRPELEQSVRGEGAEQRAMLPGSIASSGEAAGSAGRNRGSIEDAQASILVTDRSVDYLGSKLLSWPLPNCLLLRPKTVVVGLGCRRGAALEEIERALNAAFDQAQVSERSILCFATADRKSGEAAILQAADRWRAPVCFYAAEELETVSPPNPSSFVRKEVGAWGVAEPAAMLASGADSLLLPKTALGPVTVALARGPWPSWDSVPVTDPT